MTVSTQVPTAAEMFRANMMSVANGTFFIAIGIVRAAGGLTDDLFLYVVLAYGALSLVADWYLFGSLRRSRALHEDRLLALIAPILIALPFLIVAQEVMPANPIDLTVVFSLMIGTATVVTGLVDLRGPKGTDAR